MERSILSVRGCRELVQYYSPDFHRLDHRIAVAAMKLGDRPILDMAIDLSASPETIDTSQIAALDSRLPLGPARRVITVPTRNCKVFHRST